MLTLVLLSLVLSLQAKRSTLYQDKPFGEFQSIKQLGCPPLSSALLLVMTVMCNADCSDKNNPRMSTENCNIRGQEDDLSCRADGATRDKLVMLATDLVGLGIVLAVYRIVSS